MFDPRTLREPKEVFEAAAGNPEPLANRIESGAEMHKFEREALVAFIRGRLVPPKRGRGQRTLPHLDEFTRESTQRLRIKNAVVLLRDFMWQLKERGENYGNFSNALEEVAKRHKLTTDETEQVLNLYRRKLQPNVRHKTALGQGVVMQYHKWLLRTGRLPEFPQRLSIQEVLKCLDGQSDQDC